MEVVVAGKYGVELMWIKLTEVVWNFVGKLITFQDRV